MTIYDITGVNGGIIISNGAYSSPVKVDAGASVLGGYNGLTAYAGWSIINDGYIKGMNGAGIALDAGGSVTNALGGGISGSFAGVLVEGASGAVSNDGGIVGSDYGVLLEAGGLITNGVSGRISGFGYGVQISGDAGTVDNYGYIRSSYGVGVSIDGGSVANEVGGQIIGDEGGLEILGAAGTVDNFASITAREFGAAVYLGDGGSVTNEIGGRISMDSYSGFQNYDGVLIKGAAGTVDNLGFIASHARNSAAVYLGQGGAVSNSGTIFSYYGAGVSIRGGGGAVDNSGYIHSKHGGGIYIDADGTVENHGHISTYGVAVYIAAAGAVDNFSIIASHYGIGVHLGNGGSVTNEAGGRIGGYSGFFGFPGVEIGGSGTVDNSGIITSFLGAGVELKQGGSIVDHAGGTITGGSSGVILYGSGVVENAGLIGGGAFSVYFDDAGSNTLTVDAGAVFDGAVVAKGGGNTLELTSSAGAGTITGFGSQYQGFQTLDIDSGAAWGVKGATAGFDGVTIEGFSSHDTLTLTDIGYAVGDTATWSDDVLTISDVHGATLDTITLDGDYDGDTFVVSADGSGIDVNEMLCYLRGTRILTPIGEALVEDLRIGDLVVTRFGGIQPIKWIGRQSYAGWFVKGDRNRIPVRIAADALGPRLPARDLYVSPGHSMLVDGALLLAGLLVNGITITQHETPDEIHYYQIELAGHDCVIAEGTWSETFADMEGLREQYHNAAEFHALYPDYWPPEELDLCAPRPTHGMKLEAALRPLTARMLGRTAPGALRGSIDRVCIPGRIEGWAQDEARPELPVLLEVVCRDRVIGTMLACHPRADLAEAGLGSGKHSFVFRMPRTLPPQAVADIRVRRVADGAELRMSQDCLDHVTAGSGAPTSRLRLAG